MPFLGALIGSCIGSLCSYLIHRSKVKNDRIENQKDRELKIVTTVINKANIDNPAQLLNFIKNNKDDFNDILNEIENWNKNQEQEKKEKITETSNKLESDIIK